MHQILNKVTYHAVYDKSIMDALQYAHTNGFAGVQVAVEAPHLSFERLDDRECEEINQRRQAFNLRISLHPPDHTCSLFETSEALTRGIRDYYRNLFAFAQKTGAEIVVLHLGTIPSFLTDTQIPRRSPELSLPAHRRALHDNLQRLIELADGRIVLAVENFHFEPTTLEVLESLLAHGAVSLCWDLAKTYDKSLNLNADLEEFFWRNLAHVRQVHLHDIRTGGSHKVVGTGGVDFMRFLPRLAQANVLEYCIEVRPREKALESLNNLKQIIAQQDFRSP